MDNFEQMKSIAEQCPYFSYKEPSMENFVSESGKCINCTMCKHYDEGLCNIKDEILVNMDQT